MSLITKMLRQTAVWWPLASANSGGIDIDQYGRPVHAAPLEIKCRWEDVAVEYISPDGTQQTSKSVVYVDRDVQVGEMLMLGQLSDVTNMSQPWNNAGALEVKQFSKLPDLRARRYLRTVYL
jgi:hypothetical protein